MVNVSTAPLGHEGWTGEVNMGDPVDAPGTDPGLHLKLLEYPLRSGLYACWPVGATEWASKATPDASCYFQVSSTGTSLHAERNGALNWLLIPGLY